MAPITVKPRPHGGASLYHGDAELATLDAEDVLTLIKDLAAALEGRERAKPSGKAMWT